MCNDQYPDESIIHTKLAAWHQWINGDMGTVGGGGMASLSEEACIEREKRKDVFRLPVVVSDAECTNRALSALMAQSVPQHQALIHYHFRSTSLESVAKRAGVRLSNAHQLLNMAHDNFMHFRCA